MNGRPGVVWPGREPDNRKTHTHLGTETRMADELRLGVLTTDTAHHRYFLGRLPRELPSDARLVVSLFEERPYGRNSARTWRPTILVTHS